MKVDMIYLADQRIRVIIKVIIFFFSNIKMCFFTIAFLGLGKRSEREREKGRERERMYGDVSSTGVVLFTTIINAACTHLIS